MTKERRLRYQRYQRQRATLAKLTAADLADLGIKRWQLGAIARRMALGSRR